MKVRCVEESTAARRKILDVCKDGALLKSEISKATGIDMTAINHHIMKLFNEGYLSRHRPSVKGRTSGAYYYTTAKDELYVIPVMEVPTPGADTRVQFPTDFPAQLMRMMGYLRV